MGYARGQPSVSMTLWKHPYLAEIAPCLPDLDRYLRIRVPDGACHSYPGSPYHITMAFTREADADAFAAALVGRRIPLPRWWRG